MADERKSRDLFEHAEQKAKAVKEVVMALLLCVLLLVLVLKGRPVYVKLSTFVDAARVSKVTVAGVEFVATEDQAAKVKEVTEKMLEASVQKTGKQDVPARPEQVILAEVANKLTVDPVAKAAGPAECSPVWVYLGTGNEPFRVFRNRTMPKAGETLVANTSIFERESAPIEVGQGRWKLGKNVGVLKEGQSARVENVITIPGDAGPIHWAQVCAEGAGASSATE